MTTTNTTLLLLPAPKQLLMLAATIPPRRVPRYVTASNAGPVERLRGWERIRCGVEAA